MDTNEDDDIWDRTEEPKQTEEFVTDARKKTYNFSDNEDINNNNDEDKPRLSKNWENEENSKEQFSEHSKTNESSGRILDKESVNKKSFQNFDGLKPRRFDEFQLQEDQTSFNIRYESIYHQYESSNSVDGTADHDYNKEASKSEPTKSFLNEMQKTINEDEHFSEKFSTHLPTFKLDDHESYENKNDSEDKVPSSELITGQNHVSRGELRHQDLSSDLKDVKSLRENGDAEDFERDKKNEGQERSGKEDVHKMKLERSEIRKELQRKQTGRKSEDDTGTEIQSGALRKFRKRVKSVKPRIRSSSDPGQERKKDSGALYRPRSQPRISRESRSGEFDWSTSKNDTIQSWLKQKARLLRKQRAEERKKKRMEKNEKEEKQRQREEKFVDSVERVSKWMKQKTEQEHRTKQKQRQEQMQRQEPPSARTVKYPRSSPENSLSPDFVLHGVGQDCVLKPQKMPLLIQREKQQQALLRSFSKYLDHNRSVTQTDKEVDRKQSSPAKRNCEKPEEKLLRDLTHKSYLPSPPVRMNSAAKSNDQYALRQSLSLSRITIPSDTEKGNAAEQVKLKKKITFEEWLKQKKADDELKSQMLHRKKLGADVKELQKSMEVQKMSLASERKSAPVIGARKTGKVSESISRISTGGKPVRDVKLDAAELSATADASRHDRGTSAGLRQMIKNSDVARYSYSAFARDPRTNGGLDMHGRTLRAKSPKSEAAMRPQSSTGQVQRSQTNGFSKYVWNQVNEQEGSLVITSRDKMRLQSSGSETDKPEHNSEMRKGGNDEIRKERMNSSILSQDGNKLNRKSNESRENGRQDPENSYAWKLDKAESDIQTIIDADDEEFDAVTNRKHETSDPFGKQISMEPADCEPPTNTFDSYPVLPNGSNSGDSEAAFESD